MDTIARNLTQMPHPFYPIEANIVGYLANQWSVPTLLSAFASGLVFTLGTTLVLVQRHKPNLPSMEKATILWFVLSERAPGTSLKKTMLMSLGH